MQARRAAAAGKAASRQTVGPCAAFLDGLFGGAVDDSASYICVDCGYIYDQREPWSEVPKEYACPACYSPKRRFKKFKGEVRGRPKNDGRSMQTRMKERNW